MDAYDDDTGEHGYRCLVCELVVRDCDLPDEPPLSDEDFNSMADEAALDDLCAERGRR